METSHVIVIIAGMLFVFAIACLFFLNLMRKTAVNALNSVVDKSINQASNIMDRTISKASDMVEKKVIDPTMAVATDGMRKGIDAVGQAVKDEYQDSKRRSPANIDVEVTQLAERLKGKVTTADVTSQLKLTSKEAKDAFKRLKVTGDCTESPQGHYVLYVFSAFLEKVKVWSCGYCTTKYHEDPKRLDCPSCGAKLEIREEVVSL